MNFSKALNGWIVYESLILVGKHNQCQLEKIDENYDVSVHIRSFNRIHPRNRQKQPLKGVLKN